MLVAPAWAYSQESVLSSLSFGAFVAGSGGEVVISPLGGRSTSGTVMGLNRLGTWSQAKISVKPSGVVSGITLPADNQISLMCDGVPMKLKGFNYIVASSVVSIGATLLVAPNQKPCAYTGQFSVTINYQ